VIISIRLLILVCLLLCRSTYADDRAKAFTLAPEHVAIVVNSNDPLSVQIGEYYRKQRGIPHANLVALALPKDSSNLPATLFNTLYTQTLEQIPTGIRVFALAWATPYRVDCMSITSAFAFGFDRAFCAVGCTPTRANPYAGSDSRDPLTDFNIRPAILLAARTLEDAKALIDRGVAADGSDPVGHVFLLDSPDVVRNSRARHYASIQRHFADRIPLHVERAETIQGRRNVLMCFTGSEHLPGLADNSFLPGAIADHLTSFGGMLTDSTQASALRWLEAGATGSYGTVVEPCNIPQKFSHPGVLMQHYFQGETLIEAYWKSVVMPGQGVFIGEPLARPFGEVP
jgi:uncharacterized protein (TIGR03790 family)